MQTSNYSSLVQAGYALSYPILFVSGLNSRTKIRWNRTANSAVNQLSIAKVMGLVNKYYIK